MRLSYRMQEIMGFVTKGNRVADIGTDHGFVPIALVKDGICPSAIAVDIKTGPLSIAKEHVNESDLTDKIECRLGDGLSVVKPDEVDSIIIAGIGGDVIADILNKAEEGYKGTKELIVSPHSEIDKVRHALHDMEYKIKAEKYFQDEGKRYNVIYAVPGREIYDSEDFYKYGKLLLESSNELLKETLTMQLVVFMSARNRLTTNNAYVHDLDGAMLQKSKERQAALQEQIDDINHLLKKYY